MLVITNQPQDEINQRNNPNHPEKRHYTILNKLLKQEVKNNNGTNSNKLLIIFPEGKKNTNEDLISIIKSVHNPSLIDFLKDVYNSAKDNPDKTYFHGNGIIPYNIARINPSDKHLEKFKNMLLWKKIGFFCDDTVTPIYENTWDTALSSVLNCVNAVELLKGQNILNRELKDVLIQKPNLIYCLNIYPGHHAGYLKYGGYCFINNATVSAYLLANTVKLNSIHNEKNEDEPRVGILDLDYHAGNGTSDIINYHQTQSNPLFKNICCVSIHMNPEIDYPFYEGYEDDYENNNILNIPFGIDTKINQYMNHLTKALIFLKEHNINNLVIAFGGDTYKNDPDVSEHSKCQLDICDYFTIGKYIKSSFTNNINIIVTQEGGYNLEHIAEIAESFLNGLQDNE